MTTSFYQLQELAEIGEGSSVGAMGLVTKSLESWGIFVGSPVRKLKDRDKKILSLEKELKP
jgi:Acetyltransferase (isoleucine patch superfamily)